VGAVGPGLLQWTEKHLAAASGSVDVDDGWSPILLVSLLSTGDGGRKFRLTGCAIISGGDAASCDVRIGINGTIIGAAAAPVAVLGGVSVTLAGTLDVPVMPETQYDASLELNPDGAGGQSVTAAAGSWLRLEELPSSLYVVSP
jgi:hypothetical protein